MRRRARPWPVRTPREYGSGSGYRSRYPWSAVGGRVDAQPPRATAPRAAHTWLYVPATAIRSALVQATSTRSTRLRPSEARRGPTCNSTLLRSDRQSPTCTILPAWKRQKCDREPIRGRGAAAAIAVSCCRHSWGWPLQARSALPTLRHQVPSSAPFRALPPSAPPARACKPTPRVSRQPCGSTRSMCRTQASCSANALRSRRRRRIRADSCERRSV